MHFSCFVITKDGSEQDIENLLEPFSEHLEVEEYKTECWCVGQAAAAAVSESPSPELYAVKHRCAALSDEIRVLAQRQNKTEDEAETEALGKQRQELVEKRQEMFAQESVLRKGQMASHPLWGKPLPDCEECHGTGVTLATHNPRGRWDFWVVGGRWNGFFGEGRNTVSTETAIKMIQSDEVCTPYAIVDGDEWTDLESLAALTGKGMTPEEQRKETIRILSGAPDMTVTIVDYHS